MSWSLSLYGHAENEDDERDLLEAIKRLAEDRGGHGTFSGQHTGAIMVGEVPAGPTNEAPAGGEPAEAELEPTGEVDPDAPTADEGAPAES